MQAAMIQRLQRLVLSLVLAFASVAAADELTVTLGTTYQGIFKGVINRRFEFKTNQGRKISESVMNLKTLVMDPPVNGVVTTAFGRTTAGTLTGIVTGQVQVLDAQGMVVSVPMAQVKSVTVASDWQRTVKDDVEVVSHGEVFDPTNVVRRGKVTILHFHEPSSMSSTRQGSYVAVQARDSHGAVALIRVVIDDPEAPVMSALGLTTLPQFWFYSANGALVTKLSERFTEGDLDSALAKARHGGGGGMPARAPAAKGL